MVHPESGYIAEEEMSFDFVGVYAYASGIFATLVIKLPDSLRPFLAEVVLGAVFILLREELACSREVINRRFIKLGYIRVAHFFRFGHNLIEGEVAVEIEHIRYIGMDILAVYDLSSFGVDNVSLEVENVVVLKDSFLTAKLLASTAFWAFSMALLMIPREMGVSSF